MEYKDYYKILGISKSATPDEIKKAYRKLAFKYHPDKNQNDKSAEEKFKEVNEANEVLENIDKRKKYDELGENWKYSQQTGQYGGQGQNSHQNASGEQYNDSDFSDFFSSIFGSKYSGGKQGQPRSFKGEDYNAEMYISLEEAYSGTARQIELEKLKLQLKIKPGIKDGQILRLKEKGGKGMNGGQDGDLYISVHVSEHPQYKRKVDDLYCDINVDLYVAMLGGKTIIKTLCSSIKMDISKETDNGKVLRLKGMGMPKYEKENEYGDLYAKVNIYLPKNLSQKETELFKELSSLKNNIHAETI